MWIGTKLHLILKPEVAQFVFIILIHLVVPAPYYALFKPRCEHSAINFVTDFSVIIVTIISKYLKTTAELIFIILLRHTVLLIETNLKDVFSFTQFQALRRWFFPKTQPLVYVHSEHRSGCLWLQHWVLITFKNQTKAPRKWELTPLTSLAVATCLASRSPCSDSPCTAPNSFSKLSERGRRLALPPQTSSCNTGSDGKGAYRRPGRETELGRCRPPNFWQKSQILDGHFEVPLIIQKQRFPNGPFLERYEAQPSVCRSQGCWDSGPQAVCFCPLPASSQSASRSFPQPAPRSCALYLGSLVSGLQGLEQGEHTRTRRNSERESLVLPLPLRGEACKAHGDAYVKRRCLWEEWRGWRVLSSGRNYR